MEIRESLTPENSSAIKAPSTEIESASLLAYVLYRNMSLSSLKNLAYNILKNLEDVSVRDMEVPELEPYSECGNEILTLPIKAFTVTCVPWTLH